MTTTAFDDQWSPDPDEPRQVEWNDSDEKARRLVNQERAEMDGTTYDIALAITRVTSRVLDRLAPTNHKGNNQ